MTGKAYNPTFSIMKGVAIASVVLGHCAPSPFVEQLVNQYHLAVFFFVAGFFFKESCLATPRRYAVGRLRRLYVPYVAFGMAALLLHNAFATLHLYGDKLDLTNIYRGGKTSTSISIY